jgi:beta-lactamase regulating signal transducer with metallopeptidase domain
MGNPFTQWLFYISNSAVLTGINLLVQSTLILSLGLCVFYFLRKKGVAVQTMILRFFLLAAIVCPIASIIFYNAGVSVLTFDVPMESFGRTEEHRSLDTGLPDSGAQKTLETDLKKNSPKISDHSYANRAAAGENDHAQVNSIQNVDNPLRNIPLRAILYVSFSAIWLAISVIFLFRLILGSLKIAYLLYTAKSAGSTALDETRSISGHLGISEPRVFQNPRIISPFLTGIFNPAVLFPDSETVSREFLAHELHHIVNNDCMWNLLGRMCISIFPFQPLILVYARMMESVSDYICDDFVVKYCRNPRLYASQLLDLAQRFQPAYIENSTGARMFSSKSSLRQRVERILESTNAFSRKISFRAVLCLTLFCFSSTVITSLITFEGSISRDYSFAENLYGDELIQKLMESLSSEKHTPGYSVVDIRNVRLEGELPAVIEELPVVKANLPAETDGLSGVKDELPVEQAENIPVLADAIEESEPEERIEIAALQAPVHETDTAADIMNAMELVTPEAEKVDPESDGTNAVIAESAYESDVIEPDFAPEEEEQTNTAAVAIPEDVPEAEHEEIAVISPQVAKTVSSDLPDDIDPEDLKNIKKCKKIGTELHEANRYFSALKVFHKALALDPGDPEVYYGLGNAYLKTRDFAKAKMFLQTAIAIKPEYAQAQYLLGDVLLRTGDLDGAMKLHKTAISKNGALARNTRSYF